MGDTHQQQKKMWGGTLSNQRQIKENPLHVAFVLGNIFHLKFSLLFKYSVAFELPGWTRGAASYPTAMGKQCLLNLTG